MKNILLLTDFSDPSKNAISYALKLFEKEKCTFHLLYVQDSKSYITDDVIVQASSSLYESLVNKNRLKLINYVANLESEFQSDNFSFKVSVDYDSLITAVKQLVKTKNITLIVMGTNGATGANEVVFGSNTINVIRKVMCTTLVIPQKYVYQQPPKAMLLVLDRSDQLKGTYTKTLKKFIVAHQLALHVIRLDSEMGHKDLKVADIQELDLLVKDTNYHYYLIEHVPMVYAVSTYLQTNSIDIVGLVAQQESFLERLFVGSATTEIIKHAQFPILVFHP